MSILRVTHNAGFFSCCTVRLIKIIEFFNQNKILPKEVDSSQQFTNYKSNNGEDLSKFLFKENNEIKIDYIDDIKITNSNDEDQFSNYHFLNLKKLSYFIEKYFKISDEIVKVINNLEKKYNIDYENTISVLYRSNDKVSETNIGSYGTFFEKISECLIENPTMKILIQTDDQNFLDYCINKLGNDIIFFDEIPRINNNPKQVIHNIIKIEDRKTFVSNFLGIVKILSKSKILITHSGNCGMWTIFLRGNMDGVYQYLNPINNINNNKIGWQ